jgi:hypothetical protein
VERQGRLNAKQLKDLSDELAALAKVQSAARHAEVYIRMSPKEVEEFDERKGRISAIYVILSNHDANRPQLAREEHSDSEAQRRRDEDAPQPNGGQS